MIPLWQEIELDDLIDGACQKKLLKLLFWGMGGMAFFKKFSFYSKIFHFIFKKLETEHFYRTQFLETKHFGFNFLLKFVKYFH